MEDTDYRMTIQTIIMEIWTRSSADMLTALTNNVIGECEIQITDGQRQRNVLLSPYQTELMTKSPPYIGLKEPSDRILPRAQRLLVIPRYVRVVAARNGWMTGNTPVDWV